MKAIFLSVLVAAALFAASPTQAQRKKELKSDVERLENANNVLTQKNAQLEAQVKQAGSENRQLQSTINRLRQDSAMMRQDYKQLSEEYVSYKQQAIAKAEADAKKKNSTSYIDPSDKRPCALNAPKLQSGQSYTLKMNALNSDGWGLQVFSSNNLCLAMEKAESFSKQYKMYNTYIRVKMVNDQKVYSVVYASLKDYEQAKNYCASFKKSAKGPERDAFLVQH
jgi:predicted RNase H-like nuclease (RuvC/YqgF family)